MEGSFYRMVYRNDGYTTDKIDKNVDLNIDKDE